MPIKHINNIKYNRTDPYVKRFVTSIAPSIDALNEAIKLYNQEKDNDKKLKQLKTLYEDLKRLNNGCSDEIVSKCNYHEEINEKLFTDIQSEFKSLGIFSMQADALRESSEWIGDPSSPAEIIANMAPEKLEKFADLLAAPKYWRGDFDDWRKDTLKDIYQLKDAGYQVFQEFLKGYTIAVLVSGNNRIFKLTKKSHEAGQETRKVYILQLENRLGMPRSAEVHLRKYGLSGVFLSILADRQTVCEQGFFTRNVLVTDFLALKDVEGDRKTHPSDAERRVSAIDIYTQMAEVLGVVEANGCVFTDMKNSNWLIDASGNLRISDTKGFLFANKDGQLDLDDAEEKNGNYGYCFCPRTAHMDPPEGFENKPAVDKLHAYMLGRNLYQYLTQCDSKDLLADDSIQANQKPKSLDDLDFSHGIFTGSPGENLKVLIQNLMAEDPTKRPSVAEARERLKGMGKAPSVRESARLFECRDYPRKQIVDCMEEIEKFRVTARGVRDVKMDRFLELMHMKMEAAKTPEAMNVIKVELEMMRESLQNSQPMVQDIERRMNQWGYDMQAKGIRVGEALARVPLDERGEISKGGTKKTDAVLKAMASHRTSWRRFTTEGQEGSLDLEKSATMFKDFKKTHQDLRPEEATSEKDKTKKEEPGAGSSGNKSDTSSL